MEEQTLTRRTWAASLGIIVSRLSGILRALVVNAVFGPGPALDAFNVAMRFPTVLRDLFAEGALSSAFTKGIVEARAAGRDQERVLTEIVVTVFGAITLFLAALGVFWSRELVEAVTAHNFDHTLASHCFAFLIFYLPLAMLSSVTMAHLGVRGRNFLATMASLFFNVGSILGALLLAPLFLNFGWNGVLGLATGTLLGGGLQLLVQVIALRREGIWRGFRVKWPFEGTHPLREMTLLMFPRMVGQGAMSLALFVNTHFATAAGVGAISYITNAQNIILVPVGLFGVASGFASLPLLTAAAQAKDGSKFFELLNSASRSTLWMSSLSVVGLSLLSWPLCRLMLEYGKVTPRDTWMNALAVSAYAGSILFNSNTKVLTQGFFALGNTKQIIINSVCYLFVNATLSFLLAPKFGILGLGLSNCASALIDLLLSSWFLPRQANGKGLVGTFAIRRELAVHTLIGAGAIAINVFGILKWQEFSMSLNLNLTDATFFQNQTAKGVFHFSHMTFLEASLAVVLGGTLIVSAWFGFLFLFGPIGLKNSLLSALTALRRRL
jgi:putative peptidoglycan lipid II flippase